MKILISLIFLTLTVVAEAKIGLNVSLIYKKGIGKNYTWNEVESLLSTKKK